MIVRQKTLRRCKAYQLVLGPVVRQKKITILIFINGDFLNKRHVINRTSNHKNFAQITTNLDRRILKARRGKALKKMGTTGV